MLFHYRCVPHSVTQIAPSVALNRRKFITVRDRINPNYCQTEDTLFKPKLIPQFEIGSGVLALNLRDGPKWCNAVIINVIRKQ